MTQREKFEELAKTVAFVSDEAYVAAWCGWQESAKQQEEEIARLRKELFYMTQRCAI